MRRYATALIELIYPPRCPSCSRLTVDGDFCSRCARLLPAIGPHICRRCGKPAAASIDDCRECRGRPLHFDNARAVWVYENLARDVIHAYKFANQKSLAPALARYLAPLIKTGEPETRPKVPSPLITWVPLTRRKTWRRGYNQAKLLAVNLAEQTGLPAAALLKRNRTTEDQNQLNGQARRTNVKGAFSPIDPARTAGAAIILVDDVYTTGSTANECSKALKEAGAASVQVVTLARTVIK